MSENLRTLAAYSDAMFAGDRDAVFEHWGGPHCQDGVGLSH